MTATPDPTEAIRALQEKATRIAETMRTAQELQTAATSADGAATATVAGRRLTTLTLEPAAASVPPQKLGASIEEAVRTALTRNGEEILAANRGDRRGRRLNGAEDRLAQALTGLRVPSIDPQAVEEVARREFTAADANDYVRAVVTGRGELVSLEVSVLALRGEARESLEATVVEVVNRALGAADAAVRELLPNGDVRAKVHEITSAFNSRMDALMTRLDQIDRSLS